MTSNPLGISCASSHQTLLLKSVHLSRNTITPSTFPTWLPASPPHFLNWFTACCCTPTHTCAFELVHRTLTKRPQVHVSSNVLVVNNGTSITEVQDDALKFKKPKATPSQATAQLQHEMSIIEIDDLDDPLTEWQTKLAQQLTSRLSLPQCLKCPAKTRCACSVNYPSDSVLFYFIFPYPMVSRRQGKGCIKQDKVLISEHTTLHHHVVSVHAVRFSCSVKILLTLAP